MRKSWSAWVAPGQTAVRKKIKVNKCSPAGWDGHVELLWSAGNVRVYDAATGGVEVTSGATFANAALPTNLWVEGVSPSAATNDVVFRLNPVGLDCPNAVEGYDRVVMTAVKVTSETVATTPADRTRMNVGVAEEVNLVAIPLIAGGTWSLSGGGSLSPTNGSTTTFTAPGNARNPNPRTKARRQTCFLLAVLSRKALTGSKFMKRLLQKGILVIAVICSQVENSFSESVRYNVF